MAAMRLEAEDFNLSGNYQIDNNNGNGYNAASEGAVIAVQSLGFSNESGTAQTTLNVDSGLYNISLTYFDENDGQGQFSVNLAGQQLDSWTWDQQLQNSKVGESNRVTRVIAEQALINSGDSLSLIGTRGDATDGESLRADYIELEPIQVTPDSSKTITLQAEDMTLNSGYIVKDRAFADNGQLIHLTELTGKATTAFNGAAGLYQVVLKHHDESDGKGTVLVTIGNNAPVELTLDQDPAGSRLSADNKVETTLFQALQINSNDNIEIAAAMDKGEVAAIDAIQFIPVTTEIPDTTPPTATLTANNFNTNLNSQGTYTFTVTFADNQAVNTSNLNTAITVQDDNGVNQTVEFVGVDDNSNGSPRVATYRLNAPGGSWDINEAGSYTVIAANTVTDTSGNALAAGTLGTFNVNIQSTDVEKLKVEAEDFTLGGNYVVENGYDANIVSGGELIAIEFLGEGDETGTAEYTFTGETGSYNVVVTYFDESDGEGSLTASLNGQQLDSWTFDQNLGSTKVADQNRVQKVVAQDITINTGDVFSLAGQREVGESTRVDYVQFIAAEEDNTDPSPDINGATVSYSQSSQPILARLDQDFAIQLKYDDPIKFMPLGDSITQGKIDNNEPTALRSGYRNLLETAFDELGLKVDFVGSESNGKPGFDNDHQGHPGWKINDITFGRNGEGGVEVWLPAANPDIVLLMIGTNDRNGQSDADNLDKKLIPRIFNNLSADAELIVSTIPPVHPESRYQDKIDNIKLYNQLIPGIVDKYDALAKNISFVDIWEGQNGIQPTDMSAPPDDNGLHPTAIGYEKIADFYYQAVLDAAGTKTDFNNVSNIAGSDFDDIIFGNDSNNEILGGEGDDELTGGSGADTFIYTKLADGEDILTDFNPAEGDIFQINASGFVGSGLTAGVALSDGIASATGVFVSGENPQSVGNSANILYDTITGVLSMDIDGVESQNPWILATLDGAPTLGINQFDIA
jgi:hypothetical protein